MKKQRVSFSISLISELCSLISSIRVEECHLSLKGCYLATLNPFPNGALIRPATVFDYFRVARRSEPISNDWVESAQITSAMPT